MAGGRWFRARAMIRVHALYDKQTGRGSLSAECAVSPRHTSSLDVAPFDPGTRRNDFPFDFDSSLSRRALTSRVNRPTERHSFTAATVLVQSRQRCKARSKRHQVLHHATHFTVPCEILVQCGVTLKLR